MGYTKGYSAIAEIYDRLNAEIDYGAWADFIEKNFERYLAEKPSLLLDLACGTGSMTVALSERGYDMIGVDGSEEMLSVAYERSAGKNILYLLQDMRRFELYGTVGAVTSCLDSLNYLTGDGDLKECFSTVHNYLEPDGLFLFDMNTPYKFERVYGNNSYILEDEDAYCGWQNEYDEKTRLCRFYLSVFREDGEGRYFREDEEQCERCYSMEEIRAALAETGFELLSVSAGYDFSEIGEETERWYFAARCKKGIYTHRARKEQVRSYLGKTVEIGIDRPVGYVHHKGEKTLVYPINYGYIPNVLGGDGEELDVYLLGVKEPIERATCRVIGIAHRENDVEDKLIAAPLGMNFTADEMREAIEFQEKYYHTSIEVLEE
ncbi:MAG: methyltransferase domain-containing protein [Clostridia bacterium]|nr:methyltransferase domain-containing protein [Clostridia bacterium]